MPEIQRSSESARLRHITDPKRRQFSLCVVLSLPCTDWRQEGRYHATRFEWAFVGKAVEKEIRDGSNKQGKKTTYVCGCEIGVVQQNGNKSTQNTQARFFSMFFMLVQWDLISFYLLWSQTAIKNSLTVVKPTSTEPHVSFNKSYSYYCEVLMSSVVPKLSDCVIHLGIDSWYRTAKNNCPLLLLLY